MVTVNSSITADHQEEDVIQGLVTAGALVALADGRIQSVERDELATCMRQLMLAISDERIGELFDCRVRELKDRDAPTVVTEKLRALGLSLASVVVRTAERVAAADRRISPQRIAGHQVGSPVHGEPTLENQGIVDFAGLHRLRRKPRSHVYWLVSTFRDHALSRFCSLPFVSPTRSAVRHLTCNSILNHAPSSWQIERQLTAILL